MGAAIPGEVREGGEDEPARKEGTEKVLEKEHPDTLTSVYWLAYLLHKQKQYDGAAELHQRACDGFKKKLGPRHPTTTIACFNNYSTMQKEMGQVE